MEEVESAEAVAEKGFRGCIHGRAGSRRQILIMDREALDLLGIDPGMVKENITGRGLNLREILPGVLLKVGEALLEATVPCEPCGRMEEIRAGLKAELGGRRGWLFRVVEGGMVRRGDAIEVRPVGCSQVAG